MASYILVLSGEFRRPQTEVTQFRSLIPLEGTENTKDIQRRTRQFAIEKDVIVTRTQVKQITMATDASINRSI